MECMVCGKQMKKGLRKWHFICKNCKHESAKFKDEINDTSANANLDEDLRLDALRPIRDSNFKQIVKTLREEGFSFNTKTALDVGSAHGWFMEQLQVAGIKKVKGIEPDKRIFSKFNKNTVNGYFPGILSNKEKFDLISFNDVLEHIPDTRAALKGCYKHLNKNGLVVLNLPSSKGILYKISKLMHRLTFPSPFERLWQKGLPSPHVHYYKPKNLQRLATELNFKVIYSGKLQSVSRAGLKERIGYDASDKSILRRTKNFIVYAGLFIVSPVFSVLPSDIQLVIIQKKG